MARQKMIDLRGEKSLQVVASDLKITHQMLSAIERGGRNPSLPLAFKIASYYNSTLEELFFDLICNETLQNAAFDEHSATSA